MSPNLAKLMEDIDAVQQPRQPDHPPPPHLTKDDLSAAVQDQFAVPVGWGGGHREGPHKTLGAVMS